MFGRKLAEPPPSVFNAGTIVNVLAIPIITAALIGAGFYYTTRDELARHDLAINAEASSREKLRDEFLENSKKTADGISQLSTHTAVQDEQVKQTISSLDKISTQLDLLRQATAVVAAPGSAPAFGGGLPLGKSHTR
jgi:hypothetical protein